MSRRRPGGDPAVLILAESAGVAPKPDAALLVDSYDGAGNGTGDGPRLVDVK
jgi:hypothetical protein